MTNITIKGTASFVNLDKPSVYKDVPTAYTIDVLLTDKSAIELLNKTIDGIVKKEWGKKPAIFRPTIKDGNEKIVKSTGEVRPEYKGRLYITATNKNISDIKDRPSVVDGHRQPIDPKKVGFGDIVNVSITLIPYDMAGVKGVSARLNHVQLVQKAKLETVSNTVNVESAFDIIESDNPDNYEA